MISFIDRLYGVIFHFKYLRIVLGPLKMILVRCCQTPTPGQTWELTLLACGNKKKKNNNMNNKNPHPNSPSRGCARVFEFCMQPSDMERGPNHHEWKFLANQIRVKGQKLV